MTIYTPNNADPTIRKMRSTRGLSAKVADACGIHRAAVYQWRRVPIERVHEVADVLNIKPEDIRPDVFRPRKRARG